MAAAVDTQTTVTAKKVTPAKANKAAPAKTTPVKTAAPAPAAAAPAKKAAAPAGPKLRWVVAGDRNQAGGKEQSARVGDRLYEIKKDGDTYRATVTVDGGSAELLSDGKFSAAYAACVAHNRAN